jgi:hypothetical protein
LPAAGCSQAAACGGWETTAENESNGTCHMFIQITNSQVQETVILAGC